MMMIAIAIVAIAIVAIVIVIVRKHLIVVVYSHVSVVSSSRLALTGCSCWPVCLLLASWSFVNGEASLASLPLKRTHTN